MAEQTAGRLPGHEVEPPSHPRIDIAGAGHALPELGSITGHRRHPEALTAAGGAFPRGLLLKTAAGMARTNPTGAAR